MCHQRSTGASAEANMIVQGIYQQNMQNGHVHTLLNLSFPNTPRFLTFQPLLMLCLLPVTFSFTPASTFKNVISYSFFSA